MESLFNERELEIINKKTKFVVNLCYLQEIDQLIEKLDKYSEELLKIKNEILENMKRINND